MIEHRGTVCNVQQQDRSGKAAEDIFGFGAKVRANLALGIVLLLFSGHRKRLPAWAFDVRLCDSVIILLSVVDAVPGG